MRLSAIVRASGAVTVAAALAAGPARADFKVWYPQVEPHEFALETLGDVGHDRLKSHSGEQSFTQEIEYGVNDWWLTELEMEQQRLPGPDSKTNFSQVTTENLFQFTEPDEYWMDAGFYAEYGQTTLPDSPDETTFGPIFRKEVGRTIDTVNLFVTKDIGRYASGRPQFRYAWETRLALGTAIEPGFQAFGQPGAFGHFAASGQQDHRLGPVLFGTIVQLGPGSLK